ncbi:NAD(P)/FAD-dependent oxidoreductase [Acidisoma cladoniae]|jgi:3-phenylpropionate/trans-cinnamate dioxygenase ferredoxin reductase subunit|uniref:NAD(P)/FAD-dependent oxidoreductase n=1 Tax=Acidisoma cladoniae TaxID=3040935 RepID=UPI00254F5716|nr:FAD-dependent oxidoreductase [Acidisoma sp. PAMC 29798]
MSTQDAGMVIVGAGEAGARAAMALREHGYTGTVTLIGEERHLPYERPPLSKAAMTSVAEPTAAFILDEERLTANRIGHISGVRATSIDRIGHTVQLDNDRRVPYAKLLIATGARPRKIAIPGAGSENVLYLRNFSDALAMRARLQPGIRLVVIGGGFIGLEIAASAIARGCSVIVVEMAPRILGRAVPAEIAAVVADHHARAGVTLIVGVGLTAIERDGTDEIVVLADGRRLVCDAIIAGVGAIPECGLAEIAGLTVENGVRVNAQLVTDDPDILAAGDCCSFPHPIFDGRRLRLEAWRNAQDQGNHAARSMLGAMEAYDRVPWFWSDQHDQTLQIAGLPDEGDTAVVRDLGGAPMYFHLKAGRLVGASAVGPIGKVARDIRLAEMLIQKRARPDPVLLADPTVKLKSLLPTEPVAA